MPPNDLEGFWLPRALRDAVLRDVAWETVWLMGGAPVSASTAGAVAVRWPQMTARQWRALLDGLQRGRVLGGREVLGRWQVAVGAVRPALGQRLAGLMPALAACTGYSPAMLATALAQNDLFDVPQLDAALTFQPRWRMAARWEAMPGVAGRARFFPARLGDRLLARGRAGTRICRPAPPVDLSLGFAAGNVPGTGLLIAMLGGLANVAAGDVVKAPAVLVRNSRQEPLFAPLVLSALEEQDPDLLAGVAALVWDYEDASRQRETIASAGLMIAAAGDQTIAALDAVCRTIERPPRFHRHGHKVSFAVIDERSPRVGAGHPDTALLGALDSALWDQNGCLSARVHFVAGDAVGYAGALADRFRTLGASLPRGATPRRFIHRAFDRFTGLGAGRKVEVCSTYNDEFAVAIDRRSWDAVSLQQAVNDCQGRVAIVRPISDVMDVPRVLGELPPANLQSMSVAVDEACVVALAEAAGACGVTSVRSLGRAAFPQLAYSWDGLLPVDLAWRRPPGYFSTIEFDDLALELTASAERWSHVTRGGPATVDSS